MNSDRPDLNMASASCFPQPACFRSFSISFSRFRRSASNESAFADSSAIFCIASSHFFFHISACAMASLTFASSSSRSLWSRMRTSFSDTPPLLPPPPGIGLVPTIAPTVFVPKLRESLRADPVPVHGGALLHVTFCPAAAPSFAALTVSRAQLTRRPMFCWSALPRIRTPRASSSEQTASRQSCRDFFASALVRLTVPPPLGVGGGCCGEDTGSCWMTRRASGSPSPPLLATAPARRSMA
mmetsp:Transcript_56906/g.157493  ORF Transcript_56906/g.157493 Transcript_56906/m.157493 type:complete len:241 (-) Transcript_56906:122-844(-)